MPAAHPARPLNPALVLHRTLPGLVVLGVVVLLGSANALARQPLFSGRFADGTQLSGHISEWHSGGHPRLGDRLLFDPSRPITLLQNQTAAERTAPEKFLEMVGGDRLPFERLVPSETSGASVTAEIPHLLVETPSEAHQVRGGGPLRIRTEWLRRIVWQSLPAVTYQPNTLFYRDGSKVSFRSLRIRAASVSLLTDQQRMEVKLEDVAELHFAPLDPWKSYYQQLALLSPDCYSLLFQVESFTGLRCTLSRQRLEPFEISERPPNWYWLAAPAWSLDPLLITSEQVAQARFYWAQEIALGGMVPEKVVERSVVPHRLHAQTGTSVLGTPLVCANESFGWGFGVSTYSELYLRLPITAKVFRVAVGLDEQAGSGGCARAEIYANSKSGQPLFRSELLLGGRQAESTGAIQLDGVQDLVLVADSAHADRPAGADPFEIRDFVNWCEPRLELDRQALVAEVRPEIFSVAPGWIGWTPHTKTLDVVETRNLWQSGERPGGEFFVEVKCAEKPLLLSQQWLVPADCDTLRLHVTSSASDPESDDQPESQVLAKLVINGNILYQGKLPRRIASGGDTPADELPSEFIEVDVSALQGQDVKCELVLESDNAAADEPAWVRSQGWEFAASREG